MNKEREPANPDVPIYAKIRSFLGTRDLFTSFYTNPCSWSRCSFCTIPSKSSQSPILASNINRQIDWLFSKYKGQIPTIRQFSFGNEGSILDVVTFPEESFDHMLVQVTNAGVGRILSLETRAEFIEEERVKTILQKLGNNRLDMTVGLETQDDDIRNKIMKKNLSKRVFETKAEILGKLGVRMTVYIMIKPAPFMSEYEGKIEAEKTVNYLHEVRKGTGVNLIAYLNPTYIANGSSITDSMHEYNYQPPLMSSVLSVAQKCQQLNIPAYVGLSSEGLAEKDYTYGANPVENRVRNLLANHNIKPSRANLYSEISH